MRPFFLIPAVVGLALLPSKADAGVRIDFRFGGGGHCYPAPVVCSPPVYRCAPVYSYRSHRSSYYGCDPRFGSSFYIGPSRSVVYSSAYSSWGDYERPERVVVVREAARPSASESEVDEPAYSQLGHDWAKDLRKDIAPFDKFVSYIRSKVLKLGTSDFKDFRHGFIEAYGVNGEAAFNKAMDEARGDRPPSGTT